MKVLVTGADGQLGLALRRLSSDHEIVACSRSTLDITDSTSVIRVLGEHRTDVVVNCAAWTDVDGCEGDPGRAMAVNGTAVGVLAEVTDAVGARLAQISTDYVFNGSKIGPYVEDDEPNPVSAYGCSKLVGEQLAGPEALIVRTSWVMGPDGHNMFRTALRLLDGNDDLRFVDDQVGCPTFTDDLADGILRLLEADATGLFHVTNAGPVSWYGFVCEVAEAVGADPGRVHPIATADLDPPQPALRPANSVLENRAMTRACFTIPGDHVSPLRSLCARARSDGI